MHTIFLLIAALGSFFMGTVIVCASTIAVPYCLTLLAAAVQIYIWPRLPVETLGTWTIICGALFGFFWSLVGAIGSGLWVAFLNIFGICLFVLVIAFIIWYIGESRRAARFRNRD